MVVAGTWPFPNEPQEKLASERGLVISQHHAEPLGVNVSRWPRDIPYNYTAHPEILERVWKAAVASYSPDQEVLWTVGLRGLSDQPYADLDASVRGNPEAEGRVVSEAIADEIKIVQAVQPHAVFMTNLWMEGAKLQRSGDLTLPPNVITVWPDTGYGDMQDDGQVHAGQGAYLHVAMMNNAANQLTEMVPVDRLFAELTRYQQAGATSYLLVNTSDIRPVTMGARAIMDFGWRGSAVGTADQYYHHWAAQEFGEKAAAELPGIYKDYSAAPARNGAPPRVDGDQYYHDQARQLILGTMVQWPISHMPDQAPRWKSPGLDTHTLDPDFAFQEAEREAVECGEAQPRWDALWRRAVAAEVTVTPSRREFYGEQALTMIAINQDSNRMLLHLCRAIEDVHQGDRSAAASEASAAIQATDAIQRQEATAEYGKWKNWYRGDWLTNVGQSRSMLASFERWLEDPNSPVLPPVTWNNWEAYYHIQHYQGTKEVDTR